jgi:hypothetical protein
MVYKDVPFESYIDDGVVYSPSSATKYNNNNGNNEKPSNLLRKDTITLA